MGGQADTIVVNTCSVTAEAETTARAYIRRARRQNPMARIVVTGCYAQRAPEEVARLAGVDAVVGNSHKGLVAEVVLRAAPGLIPADAIAPAWVDEFAHTELSRLPLAGIAPGGPGRSRPVLKVQDGCSNRCSFCIIPTTRGPSRSVPLEECLESARAFAELGGQELVLSGINLGRWGRDLKPELRLADLVAALMERTALPRLRLSSIEPMDWTPELLALFAARGVGAHPRLARHFHAPLQSGADEILRRMHRRYRPWHYADKLAAMRALAPEAAVGADVMVGFPGETDALFEESYSFIARQPLTYLHLFPFSARPGTPAAALAPVPVAVKQERMAALRSLIAQKSRAFRAPFAGRLLSAVTLHGGEAMSDNFLALQLAEAVPANRMVRVRVGEPGASPADVALAATVVHQSGA
jgi:threonylcarbamoyladenosine tRNA methylthiotransferase MtaB